MQMLSGAIILLAASICVVAATFASSIERTTFAGLAAALLALVGVITLYTGIAYQGTEQEPLDSQPAGMPRSPSTS